MNHSFDIDIASLYGIEEAIIIENIAFWIKKNATNNRNYHDGYFWTYNSAEGFAEFFPYMNSQKIKRTLKKLEDKNVLKTGNYNKAPYDRTKWYAVIDKEVITAYKLPKPSTDAISQKLLMDSSKMNNGLVKNDPPIPDINTGINSDINKRPTTFQEKSPVPVNIDSVTSIIMKAFEEVFSHPHRAITRDDYIWEDLEDFVEDELYEAMVEYMRSEKYGCDLYNKKNNCNLYTAKDRCTADYINKVQGRWK